jgi:cytochrome P450
MRTPHVYQKLCDEIRNTFPTAENLTFLRLQELPYMNACLEEGMRIFPSIPTGLTRTVPSGGDSVAGEWIPGGTTVSVYSWAATHSASNFVDPEVFVPERWLEDKPARYNADRNDASQPFSLGPRGCIGRHLSYMELRLILGQLCKLTSKPTSNAILMCIVWHFDIRRADLDSPDAFDIWDPTGNLRHVKAFNTWNKPPLMCKLTPVKR